MNSNASQPPAQTPSETAVARRDRALRLRTRVLFTTVTSAVLAVGGLGVLAEHTYAGRSTSTASSATTPESATASSSPSGSSSSNASSSNAGSTVSTSAPSSSRGSTTIVSGGS